MAYVVAATWHAKPGEQDRIREILGIMTPLTRDEPGCLMYVAHHSPDDPHLFFLYEQYDSEESYRAHTETDYFNEYVLGQAVPRLDSRERAYYLTLD